MGNINENSSIISSSINKLKKDGHAYEKDNAIWLNTESSGDDKHRVLVRDDGRPTYFASDVAYHKDKIDRGFDKLINVWGADHHGYIKRIEASIEALGSEKEKMIVKLVQFANLYKNGKKVKMSTRSGDFFTLENLIDEIGYLETLFSQASIAFIGGSLIPRGGQNFLEALKFSLPISSGESFYNFQEIAEDLIEMNILKVGNSAEKLKLIWEEQLNSVPNQIYEKTDNYLKQRMGASQRAFKHLSL